MTMRGYLLTSLFLSAVGVLIGLYLVWVHYHLDALVCGIGDCETVQTSSYATVMGVPIAWFGLLMYVTLLALAGLRLWKPELMLQVSTAALAITAAGTLYSGWLTWVEIYVIEAICQWCVAPAVITTLLFVIEVVVFRRLWSGAEDNHPAYLEELSEP